MPVNDAVFLAAIVGAFVLFGGALAWASWMESRAQKKRS